jgi:pyruvate-formate lyase
MDNVKLKELVLKELQKEVPQEIAKDEKKAKEFIVSTINEPLVDKLVAEFCEKNPQDTEVLNVFNVSDEELKEIKENIAAKIADGTVERIKYEQAINHAGLAYKIAVVDEYFDELDSIIAKQSS